MYTLTHSFSLTHSLDHSTKKSQVCTHASFHPAPRVIPWQVALKLNEIRETCGSVHRCLRHRGVRKIALAVTYSSVSWFVSQAAFFSSEARYIALPQPKQQLEYHAYKPCRERCAFVRLPAVLSSLIISSHASERNYTKCEAILTSA